MSYTTKISEIQSLKKSLETENLYELYKKAWTQEFRDKAREKYSVVGSLDEEFIPWPKDPMAVFTTDKGRYNVQIPCNLIESCPTYNRTMDISFELCVFNLDYADNTFDLDGTEVITVYFDRKRGVFRTSRGNHRTLMKLLAEGDDATICCKLFPHDISLSDDEMLLIEATNFDQDNQFLGMTKTMKFKGHLFHDLATSNKEKSNWAKELYLFLDSCNPKIGISGTNLDAEIELDAFGAVKHMLKEYYEPGTLEPNSFLKDVLESQAKYAKQINGDRTYLSATLTRALAYFKKQFQTEIERVGERNNINVWDAFLKYIFTERGAMLPMFSNLKQADLIKGNSLVRITEYHVATLATLFNEFVSMKQLKHHNQKSAAITTTTKSWKQMLENEVKPYFHTIVNSNLGVIYSPQV